MIVHPLVFGGIRVFKVEKNLFSLKKYSRRLSIAMRHPMLNLSSQKEMQLKICKF